MTLTTHMMVNALAFFTKDQTTKPHAKSEGRVSISDFAQDIAFNPHTCFIKTFQTIL
jgi:hypothetical protein